MKFNIISNLSNGVGLQRDFILLQQELQIRGHQVQGVQFNAKPLIVPPADVNIFDELVVPAAFRAAPVQWVLPHPEWWSVGNDNYYYDKVLAKTHDCERIFRARVGDRCQYLGWMAKDMYQPGILRQRQFLHVSGKSSFKNTHAVIQGCQLARVPLTVVGQHTPQPRRVSEGELIRLMNSHFCHVMPSAYEGYGHVLHESQSVGQVLITTEAPPMNEILPSFRIPSVSTAPHLSGTLHYVSAADVCNAVTYVMALSLADVATLAEQARAQFDRDQRAFQVALDALVAHPSKTPLVFHEHELVFADHGHPLALHNVLHSIATQRKIDAYLEVGVCAGESVRMVIQQQFPERMMLCDTWGGEYGGQSFGDARHIEWLMHHLQYPYPVTFLNGSSHQLLKSVTDQFDLITVDGDHSAAGAREDLEDCWRLLRPQGLLVFDDLCHVGHPELAEVFREFAESVQAQVVHEERTPMGVGVLCRKT